MSEQTKVPEKTPQSSHHHDELAEVKQLIETYGKPVITTLLAGMIAVGAFQLYTTHKRSHAEEAARKLATAKSIPDLEDVLENYSNTASAPAALLSAAKLYFDNGNYEIALTKYEEFLENNTEDTRCTTAELGRIFCIETRGNSQSLQEAAEAFAAFAKKHSKSFLTPQALFGQARCFEQLGKRDEAKAIYEEFIAEHAESNWLPQAEHLLEQISKDVEQGTAEPVAPTVITVPEVTIPMVETSVAVEPETEAKAEVSQE